MEKHGGYDAPMWNVHMYPMLQQVTSELVITMFCLWRGDYFKGGVLTLNSGLNSDEQSQLKHMVGAKFFCGKNFFIQEVWYGVVSWEEQGWHKQSRYEFLESFVAHFCSSGSFS